MNIDETSFEDFVREHQNMVYASALRLTGNRSDAQDIAQETFLRAFRHYDSIRDHPGVRGWLRTVSRRLCINHLTRYRNRWRLFTDWITPHRDDQASVDPEEWLPAPDSSSEPAERNDQHAVLHELLQRLPDHQRVPLVLYHFDALSYEEIAEALHVSLAKVKTDIHRARLALKKKIQTHAAAREAWEDLPSSRRPPSDRHPQMLLLEGGYL